MHGLQIRCTNIGDQFAMVKFVTKYSKTAVYDDTLLYISTIHYGNPFSFTYQKIYNGLFTCVVMKGARQCFFKVVKQ